MLWKRAWCYQGNHLIGSDVTFVLSENCPIFGHVMSGEILSCRDGSLQTGLHFPESARSAPLSILRLLFVSCWHRWFSIIIISSQHLRSTGCWTSTDNHQPPPWKSCQPDEHKKATRLTDFRPRNGSFATFKLFTSSLRKLLSSQFLDLALWVYRIRFQMLTSVAGCRSSHSEDGSAALQS